MGSFDPTDLVQTRDVLGREFECSEPENVLELLERADANDRDDPLPALAYPRDRHLRRGRAELVGDSVDLVRDLEVALGETHLVPLGAHGVGWRVGGAARVLSAEDAAAHRRPRGDREAKSLRDRQELALPRALDQAVLELQGHKGAPAAQRRQRVRL
jgi:hypothetical protein